MKHLALCLFLFGCGSLHRGNNCPSACTKCDASGACKDCTPGQNFCQGDTLVACNSDGTLGSTIKTCDTAHREQCMGNACLGPCDVAAATHSYIGCDYWPTTTLTTSLNPYFDFAVAVANPSIVGDVVQNAPAQITITQAGMTIATGSVNPGEVYTFKLPWVSDIAQNPTCQNGNCVSPVESSALSSGAAYHLVSNMPVTVYQFSPLQFEKPRTKDCVDPPPNDKMPTCHSYTNDASVLLPTTALQNDYIAISRQTTALTRKNPATGKTSTSVQSGYVAVVATKPHTTVHVTSSAYAEGGFNVDGMNPGDKGDYLLEEGDVLEIVSGHATKPCVKSDSDFQGSYCDLGPNYDLTGTLINADKPIAVFGGHTCTFVPYNKWACDHLEEQIFPLETWGKQIAVAQTMPQAKNEPNVWRIISGSDNNQIFFDPPVHASATLQKAQYFEFSAQGGFVVSGTGRIAVAQYMVGEDYTGTFQAVGDPSLGLGVPIEQYRLSYDFLAPETYTVNFLNVIAPTGASLRIDGQPVLNSFTPIGASGYEYAQIMIPAGAHHVTSMDAPFGITVSGLGSFTSYLYVGGLNLNEIPAPQ